MKNFLLASDDFTAESARNWIVETDGTPRETAVVFGGSCVDAQSPRGITLWYKTPFSGTYRIEYDVEFVPGGAVRYFVNGECLVDYLDRDAYPGGHFAFRTVTSHIRMRRFRAFAL